MSEANEMNTIMKTITLFAVVAMASLAPQAAQAHDHHDRDWRNNQHYAASVNYNGNPYYNNFNGNPYANAGCYGQPTHINNAVGADGYPAWMGGYRPYRR